MRKLMQQALQVLYACNLNGVTRSFSDMVRQLNDLGVRPQELPNHPVYILWFDKIMDLSSVHAYEDAWMRRFGEALRTCEAVAAGPDPRQEAA